MPWIIFPSFVDSKWLVWPGRPSICRFESRLFLTFLQSHVLDLNEARSLFYSNYFFIQTWIVESVFILSDSDSWMRKYLDILWYILNVKSNHDKLIEPTLLAHSSFHGFKFRNLVHYLNIIVKKDLFKSTSQWQNKREQNRKEHLQKITLVIIIMFFAFFILLRELNLKLNENQFNNKNMHMVYNVYQSQQQIKSSSFIFLLLIYSHFVVFFVRSKTEWREKD